MARQLSPTGELGSIWSLGRPLVYRSIEILEQRQLIQPSGNEPGARGPNRTIFRATAAGHAAVAEWLSEPVEHIRESRSLLLLKLVFAERSCTDPRAMLVAQYESVAAAIESLEARVDESAGTDAILLLFRLESTRAVLRFLEAVISERTPVARAV